MKSWNEQVGTIKNNGKNSVEEVRETRKDLSNEKISLNEINNSNFFRKGIKSCIEDETFVLIDKETGVTSQGETKRQALENLREALILFKEEFGNGN
jgi:hypothetical protein